MHNRIATLGYVLTEIKWLITNQLQMHEMAQKEY